MVRQPCSTVKCSRIEMWNLIQGDTRMFPKNGNYYFKYVYMYEFLMVLFILWLTVARAYKNRYQSNVWQLSIEETRTNEPLASNRCCVVMWRTPLQGSEAETQVMMCGGCRSCLCLSAAVLTKLNKISDMLSRRWNHRVFASVFGCLLELSARGGQCACLCVFMGGLRRGVQFGGLKITSSQVTALKEKKLSESIRSGLFQQWTLTDDSWLRRLETNAEIKTIKPHKGTVGGRHRGVETIL